MAFIPVPGVVRIAFEGRTSVSQVVNVLHFRQPAGAGDPDVAEAASDAWAAWVANILPVLSNAYTLVSVRATDLTASDAPVASFSEATPRTGGITGEGAPLGAAVVATLRTANRGRTARGRIYLGPLGEGQMSNGQVLTASLTAISLAIEEFRVDMSAQGWNLGVVSTQEDGQPRAAGLYRPVTDITIRSPLVGYQRARQGRP